MTLLGLIDPLQSLKNVTQAESLQPARLASFPRSQRRERRILLQLAAAKANSLPAGAVAPLWLAVLPPCLTILLA